MKEHYQKMFAYNHWANRLFLDSLAQPTVANAKNFLLMSHILTAEEVWLCRLLGLPAPLEHLWQEYPVEELMQKQEKSRKAWESYIEECSNDTFATTVHYTNTKGKSYTSTVADVLNHVINHGTYHRAQIASLLRLESEEPPVTDYIFYLRQQQEGKN